MSARRAVVTGGAGFIGRAFIQRLQADGWHVRGVDVRPAPQIEIADIVRAGDWTSLLDGADLVVHAAAQLGDSGDDHAHREVNVIGTRTVLEACLAAGVGRVLHLSSAVVTGLTFPDQVDERHPVQMTGTPYVDSKVAAEHVALSIAARGLPLTIIRPAHVYGPHSAQWTVRVVELIARGLFVLIDGGHGVMSPTYIDDLVDGGIACATTPEAVGHILHINGGTGVSAATFFGHYAAMLDKNLSSMPRAAAGPLSAAADRVLRPLGLPPPFSGRSYDLVSLPGTYSIAKVRQLVGWEPQVSLEAGMAATEVWLRDVKLLPGH